MFASMMNPRSEFDFFEFETKLRALVSSLLSPLASKTSEHEALLKNLLGLSKQTESSMENFESLLSKSVVKMVPSEHFNKKIIELHTEKQSSDTALHIKLDSLGSRVDFMNHQFSDMSIRLKSLEEVQRHLRSNLEETSSSIRAFKEETTEKLIRNEIAISSCSQVSEDLINDLEKQVRSNTSLIQELNINAFPELEVKLEQDQMRFVEINRTIAPLFEDRVLQQDLKKLKNKLDYEVKKNLKETHREIKEVKEYLDKMLRVEISCGISDTLLQVLDNRQIKKLIPVVEGQLNEFSESKIDGESEVSQGSAELLRKKTLTQNQVMEAKLQAAKEKLIQEGIKPVPLNQVNRLDTKKVDDNSPERFANDEKTTKRERERQRTKRSTIEIKPPDVMPIYKFVEINPDDNKANIDSKPLEIPVIEDIKEKEIPNLPSFVDTPMKSDKSSEDSEKISEISLDPIYVQEQLSQLNIDMKILQQTKEEAINTMNLLAQALRTRVAEAEKSFTTMILLLNDENKQLAKQRLKDLSDITANVNTSINGIYDKLSIYDEFDSKFSRLNDMLINSIEAEKIIYQLIAQDEEDRKSIQLMGYSEAKPKPKTAANPKRVVSLKPECLSCTGENPLIYTAFKMACLSYSPSDIKYNLKQYPRKVLIEKLGEFIESISEGRKEGFAERFRSLLLLDDSNHKIKSHYRTRTTSRHILDLSSTKTLFDPETPLHSKRDIRILFK